MRRICTGRVLILACLLFSGGVPLLASSSAAIEGRAVRSTGEGVPRAEIELRSQAGEVVLKTESGADGAFRFSVVEPGDYRLAARAAGYYPVEYDVTLRPRQALLVTLELVPQGALREELEVHAAYSELGTGQSGTSRLLTREILDRLPAPIARDLPSLALNLFPTASLSHDNFVHVRGNEVSLHEFINGVGFLDNPQQEFGPGASPLMFETANLITGWFPAEFGNRFGGVLDATSRSGFDLSGHGSAIVGVGSFQSHDVSVEYGGTANRFGYYVFASGFTSDWYLNPPERRQLHDFGSGVRGAAQFDYRGTRDTVKLLLLGGGTNFDLPNSFEDQAEGRNAARRARSQTAILTWQRVFSSKAVASTSLYERTVGDRLVPTTDPVTEFGDGSRSNLTAGVKGDLSYLVGQHAIKAGFDVTRIRLLESFRFDSRMSPPLPPDELAPFLFRGGAKGKQASVYLQDHFRAFRNATLDLGVRYDYFDLIGTHAQTSPRTGFAYYVPKTRSALHFAYSRMFSPYPLEYAALASFLGTTAADPDQRVGPVKPYVQNYYELGWKQELHPKVFLELNVYRHRGRTPFEYREIGETRLFLPINSARATSRGVEFSIVLKQLESIGLSGRLEYAAQRTFFYGPISGGFASGEEKLPGERFLPAFDETHTGTASLFYRNQWRDFWTGMNLRYGSGTAAQDGAFRLPQHLALDLSSGLTLRRHEQRSIELEFNIANVTDNRFRIAKESEETPIQFASPRIISGHLKWRF